MATMKPLTTTLALAALTLTAACSSDSDGTKDKTTSKTATDPTPCTEMFAVGRHTDDVVADYNKGPCLDEAGNQFITAIAFWDCGDGTKVHVVDPYGWGRTGDVWQGPDVPKPPSTNPDGAHAGCP